MPREPNGSCEKGENTLDDVQTFGDCIPRPASLDSGYEGGFSRACRDPNLRSLTLPEPFLEDIDDAYASL